MPADRMHHVLRGLLDSPEKFLRFLRALLGGLDAVLGWARGRSSRSVRLGRRAPGGSSRPGQVRRACCRTDTSGPSPGSAAASPSRRPSPPPPRGTRGPADRRRVPARVPRASGHAANPPSPPRTRRATSSAERSGHACAGPPPAVLDPIEHNVPGGTRHGLALPQRRPALRLLRHVKGLPHGDRRARRPRARPLPHHGPPVPGDRRRARGRGSEAGRCRQGAGAQAQPLAATQASRTSQRRPAGPAQGAGASEPCGRSAPICSRRISNSSGTTCRRTGRAASWTAGAPGRCVRGSTR